MAHATPSPPDLAQNRSYPASVGQTGSQEQIECPRKPLMQWAFALGSKSGVEPKKGDTDTIRPIEPEQYAFQSVTNQRLLSTSSYRTRSIRRFQNSMIALNGMRHNRICEYSAYDEAKALEVMALLPAFLQEAQALLQELT